MEAKFVSVESSRVMLAKELDSLKMVQDKLSRDLVVSIQSQIPMRKMNFSRKAVFIPRITKTYLLSE